MAYLSLWQAFTYAKAMAKKIPVKKNMTTSCITGLRVVRGSRHRSPVSHGSRTSLLAKPFDCSKGKIKKK
jgi:hypothetical protein